MASETIERPPRLSGLLEFIRGETLGGVLLMAAALTALVWANSPWSASYKAFIHLPVALTVGRRAAAADVHFLVDDGLMALFFLLVGLEIRRELTEGQLASPARAAAPGIAALGGMVAPALIYLALTWHDPGARRGWAIPVATDIAFSLAVLRLLGRRVPPGLKVFLTALAIIDDLGAILVIALFYSLGVQLYALAGAAVVWLALLGLNRAGVRGLAPYLAGLVLLWVCMVHSGVHATLAGVALAFAVPMRGEHSTGRRLEHGLHPIVSLVVLPLFGLVEAGVRLSDLSWGTLTDPVVPGIVLGLFVGKQIGVFGATWAACRARLIALPAGLSQRLVYGASLLCGIGFTMSLFIGNLAFPDGTREIETKASVFAASLLAAAAGLGTLAHATRRKATLAAAESEPERA